MKWLCIVVFLFIFFTKHALAEKIVVSATRLSQGMQNSGSRVEVWEADELSKTQSFDAKKVFSNAVGLQTNSSGGPGQSATVFIRGANSEHTLFLLDGIELNEPLTPTRNFDFSQFALQGVEKVEILRGPQSVLYGSDALGGVILMQQKKWLWSLAIYISGQLRQQLYNANRK
jgi:vitamin B12 transporter